MRGFERKKQRIPALDICYVYIISNCETKSGIFITPEIILPTFSQLYVYHVVKDIFHDVICS